MAVQIPLTRGVVAIVDDEDAYLAAHKWYARPRKRRDGSVVFYAVRIVYSGARKISTPMHRVICCAPQGSDVDHASGDGLDNRRANLRVCSRAQNTANSRPWGKKSRFKGVSRQSRGPNWCAKIYSGGVARHLGTFPTEEDAARAYDRAAKEVYGPFARLNLSDGTSP